MSDDNVVAVYVTSSQLHLYGNWTKLTTSGSSDVTLAVAESTASGTLEFDGTKVGVYGVLDSATPVTSVYSIDGASPVTYTSPTNVTAEQDGATFFESPTLTSGPHQLVFNITNATADDPFILEFLLYIPSTSTTVPGVTYTSANLGTSTSAPSVIVETSRSKTPVGAIVGGVVGGVAGLVILALVVFFLMRRRRGRSYFYQSTDISDMLNHEVKPSEVSPYPSVAVVAPVLSHDGTSQSAAMSPPASNVGGESYFAEYISQQPQMTHATSAAGSSSYAPPASIVSSPNQQNSKAAQAGLLSVAQPATFHADSGVRFGPSGEPSSSAAVATDEHDIPTDVPPSYSEN